MNPKDSRLKISESSKPKEFKRDKDQVEKKTEVKETKLNKVAIREIEQNRTSLYFEHNT